MFFSRTAKKKDLILDILAKNPKGLFGSEIVAYSDKKLSMGNVYVYLGNLVDQGKVSYEREVDGHAIPRTRFKITNAGHRARAIHLIKHQLLSV